MDRKNDPFLSGRVLGTNSDARGRRARKPSSIPKSGWKDIARRVYAEFVDDRVTLTAAGVTFYLLLALVPLLSALVSVWGLFLDPVNITAQVRQLGKVLPSGGLEIVIDQLERMTGAGRASLGFAFAASLALALWSANAGMKALFKAMNIAYDEREHRGVIRLNLITLAFTGTSVVALLVLIGGHSLLSMLASSEALSLPFWIVDACSLGLSLALVLTFLACLYRFGPCRQQARWKWITPGALVAFGLIVLVSIAFSVYVTNFNSYNKTYGSLGAAVGFLTWIWLTLVVIMIGGELNSEMEHQTAMDTTTGEEQPLGERGAVMADSVAETSAPN